MDGTIARVSAFRQEMTAAQIRSMMFTDYTAMAALSSGVDEAKCVGWWQFDEGTGTSVDNKGTAGDYSNEDGVIASAGTTWAGAGTLTWTGGGTPSAGTLDMTGTGTMTVPSGIDFFNLTVAASGQTTTVTVPAANNDLDVFGTLTVGAGTFTDGSTNLDLLIKNAVTPVVHASSNFANIDRVIYNANSTAMKATTYANLLSNGTSQTFAGNVVVNNAFTLDSASSSTLSTAGHNLTTKTVSLENGTTLTLAAGTTLTFTDVSGCGFGSSVGTLTSSGTSGDPNTITSSAGGTPSNYWDFQANMTIVADYTTFSKYGDFEPGSGGVDIDNCTFTAMNRYAFKAINGTTITSFTNNTFSSPIGSGAYAMRLENKAHTAFDNIVISGFTGGSQKDVSCETQKIEFTNSNFDITNSEGVSSGGIISKDHNDTENLYEILLGGSRSYSSFVNQFDTDADVKLRGDTLVMNSDNKVCDTFNVFSDATIRVSDGIDLYVQQTFDNDGTWDQSAGYGGDIHVGDFTPFDSGDILDNTDFVDTGFHDTTHYLEMDL